MSDEFEIIEPDGVADDLEEIEKVKIDLFQYLTDQEIMQNITGIKNIIILLRMLMEAVHGEEVRGAIHDAILQVYEDAINADPANTILEVILARGEYDSLRDRIEAIVKEIESIILDCQEIVEKMEAQTKILIQTTEPEYQDNAVWINPNGTEQAETITLSLQSNFTAYSSNADNIPTVTKGGNMAHLSGLVSPPSSNNMGSATATTICTLPELYRPKKPVYQVCQGDTHHKWLLTVNTNGTVQGSRYSTGSGYATPGNTAWMPFNASWVIG